MKNKDDTTYDWFNPIDGEYTVIIESQENDDGKEERYAMDMKYGFISYMDYWKEGSEVVDSILSNLPKFVADLSVTDTSGTVWIPYFINTVGVIICLVPKPKGDGDPKWACYRTQPMKIVEKDNLEEYYDNREIIITTIHDSDGDVKYVPQKITGLVSEGEFDEFTKVFGMCMEEFNKFRGELDNDDEVEINKQNNN